MRRKSQDLFYWGRSTTVSLGAIALGTVTLLLPGCTGWNQARNNGQTTVTAEDVAQQPSADKLVGQTITIRGMPGERIGTDSFTRTDNAGNPILVINPASNTFRLPQREMPVQVTGRVENLVSADMQQKYGIKADPNLYSRYEGKPTLIAQSLALAPRPQDLATAPEGYFNNQPIAVEGDLRKLEDTPNAFALFEEGWADDIGVLVVAVDRNLQAKGKPLEAGGNVVVTGVTRPFNAELARQSGLGWDAQKTQEFQSRYTNRPVIVADGVYPSAVSPAPGS